MRDRILTNIEGWAVESSQPTSFDVTGVPGFTFYQSLGQKLKLQDKVEKDVPANPQSKKFLKVLTLGQDWSPTARRLVNPHKYRLFKLSDSRVSKEKFNISEAEFDALTLNHSYPANNLQPNPIDTLLMAEGPDLGVVKLPDFNLILSWIHAVLNGDAKEIEFQVVYLWEATEDIKDKDDKLIIKKGALSKTSWKWPPD